VALRIQIVYVYVSARRRRGRRRGQRSIPPWRGVQSRESESGDVASTRPVEMDGAQRDDTRSHSEREREREKKKAACAYACGGDSLSRSLGNIREYDDVTTGRLEPCASGGRGSRPRYIRWRDERSMISVRGEKSAGRQHLHSTLASSAPRILGCGEPRVVAAAQHEDPLTGGHPALDFLHLHAASAA
jgi:hypothetical protein